LTLNIYMFTKFNVHCIHRLNCNTFTWEKLQTSGVIPELRCGAVYKNWFYAPSNNVIFTFDFCLHKWGKIRSNEKAPQSHLIKDSRAILLNHSIIVNVSET